MKYKKYNINNNDVYFIKTKKYKSIVIDTIFINEYDKKDFTKYKLLSNFLCKSTRQYPDEIKLSRKIIDLYDLNISIFNTYLNYHTQNFRLSFLNEKYTEKGMNEKSINFYYDMIYKPNTQKNAFEKDNFNLSKYRLESFYKSRLENPNFQAEKSAFTSISYDVPLKYAISGNTDDLKKITPENLFDLYNKQLNNSDVKVFVIGDFDDEKMINVLKKNLKQGKSYNYKIESFIINNKTEKVLEKIEEKDFNQSILLMIYKVLNLSRKEKEIILPVFSEILGGSNSKLFNNVREKNSLAYYIYSSIFTFQSTLIIESGISKDNYRKAKKIIIEQIQAMIDGKITDSELKSAKEKICSGVLYSEDSIERTLNTCEDEVIFCEFDNKEFVKKIMNVTKEDLMHLGEKLCLDVDYLLKGVKE